MVSVASLGWRFKFLLSLTLWNSVLSNLATETVNPCRVGVIVHLKNITYN